MIPTDPSTERGAALRAEAEKLARRLLALIDMQYDNCMSLMEAEPRVLHVAGVTLANFAEQHGRRERLLGRIEELERVCRMLTVAAAVYAPGEAAYTHAKLKQVFDGDADALRAELAAPEKGDGATR